MTITDNTESKSLLVTKKRYDVQIDGIDVCVIIDPKNNNVIQSISQMTLHIHSHAELFVCVAGEITIKMQDGTVSVSEGKGLIVPPLFPHSKIIKENENAVWCAIGFSFSKKGSAKTSELSKSLISLCNSEKPFIIDATPDFAHEIYSVCKNDDGSSSYLPALRVTTELCKILPRVRPHSEKTDGISQISNDNMDRLARLDDLISVRFMEDIRSDKVAQELFICERQLARIVKAAYGTTLHTLINDRRLETACKLLLETDICAESIGYCVGYKSKTGFYSEFKKRYGITPIAYRTQNAALRPKQLTEMPLKVFK